MGCVVNVISQAAGCNPSNVFSFLWLSLGLFPHILMPLSQSLGGFPPTFPLVCYLLAPVKNCFQDVPLTSPGCPIDLSRVSCANICHTSSPNITITNPADITPSAVRNCSIDAVTTLLGHHGAKQFFAVIFAWGCKQGDTLQNGVRGKI